MQLGKLDLRLPLNALGVCGEDVEDQRRAVDDLDADPVLQVAELGERQLAVADDRICAGRNHDVPQLSNLAAPDVGSRVRSVAALDQALEDLRSGGLRQQLEFGDGMLSAHLTAGGPHADQNDALQEQLAVLDLGDVGQLGRHPRNSAQGQPILEILLISVDVWGTDWPRLEPLDEQLVIWCGGKLWVALGNCHVRTRISRQPKSQLSVLYGRAAASPPDRCASSSQKRV